MIFINFAQNSVFMSDFRNGRRTESDSEFESRIRPQELEQFSGQDKTVENLKVFIKAALMRGDSLDHVLLHGPPGLGKTTLANIIANEMGAQMKITSGPVLDKPGDLAGLLTNLSEGDVLFIGRCDFVAFSFCGGGHLVQRLGRSLDFGVIFAGFDL